MRKNEKQREIYIKAVDKTLNDILGKTAAEMIYNYLEERCKIKKEEIPSKMQEFIIQLQKILGNAAEIIEEKIEENITLVRDVE